MSTLTVNQEGGKSFLKYLRHTKLNQETLAKRMGIGRTTLSVMIAKYDILDRYSKAELLKHSGYNDPNFVMESAVGEEQQPYNTKTNLLGLNDDMLAKLLKTQDIILDKLDKIEAKLSQK